MIPAMSKMIEIRNEQDEQEEYEQVESSHVRENSIGSTKHVQYYIKLLIQ